MNTFYTLYNTKVAKLLEESDSVLSEIVSGLYLCVNYNENQSMDKEEGEEKQEKTN